jgi:transposase-like protein
MAISFPAKEQQEQAKSVLRAAWKMEAQAGTARIRKLAEWLDRDYLSAAASLREGLDECFTINRLGVPPSLHRYLATTNIIETRMPACTYAPAASATGRTAPWLAAGWLQPSCARK